MSTSRAAAGLLIAAALLALAPIPVAAHALGGVFTLPVPLGLYLVAAGATVAVSFAVAVLVVRPAGPVASYPTRPLGAA
jgi:succinate dehydrogenase/fumarate reductase cytochrome b subunit